MPIEVLMPHMGESVVEGKILRWLKHEGETVGRDETIAEVETDKADVEIPAPQDAVLVKILAHEGDTVPDGTAIAVLETRAASGATTPAAPAPAAREAPAVTSPATDGPRTGHGELTITPVVAKVMERHGLGMADIQKITGSGAGGRVTKQDILAYLARRAPTRPEPQSEVPAGDGIERVPLTGLRKAIAEHMVRSKRTAPHVTTVTEVDMTALVEFRERYRDRFAAQEHVPLTYLPFIVRAACAGLKAFPPLNASLEGETILLRRAYHVGVAVATDAGLVVPVIRHADRLTIRELAHALYALAERARARKLLPEDLDGATFTISNPGSLGGVLSTPIIHQPQAAILGVQAIRQVPVARNSRIEIGSMMFLCLSYDHRIADGATAVRFLQALRRDLENPLEMFV